MNQQQFDRASRKAALLRRRVQVHLLTTREDKYSEWVRTIEAARGFLKMRLPFLNDPFFRRASLKLELIDTLYALLRMVDDYVDGDAPLPPPWRSAVLYVESLLQFDRSPTHDMGEMLDYVVVLADMLEIEVGDAGGFF